MATAVSLLLLGVGCGPVVPDETMAVVVDSLGLAPVALPPEGGATTVYVDRSASIRPFVASDEGVLSDLFEVLDAAYQARFLGFGFLADGSQQTLTPLPSNPVQVLQPERFVDVNNDYGALFQRIARENTGTHLVLSDGVQSDPNDGAWYRPIVEPIGRWLESGRVFAVITFRVPYRGTYYSEISAARGAGTAVPFSCVDRPLHLFAFLPSPEALGQLRDNLTAAGLVPDFQIAIGAPMGELTPLERPASHRGAKDLMSLEATPAASAWPAYSARPNLQEGQGHLPFEVRPDSAAIGWDALGPEARQGALRAAEVEVRMVALGNLRRDPPRLAETPRPTRANVTPDSAGALGTTRVPIAPPTGGVHVAWLAVARMTPLGAQDLVPEALTTRDDSAPASCSQTLNFRQLLGAILQEHYVLGRALVVTEQ